MLVENRQYLRWVVFPSPEQIRPSWRTVYLQCGTVRWLPTHVRRSFQTYQVDLTPAPEALLEQYAAKTRQKIRKARRLGMWVERDEDPTEVIRLFRPIVREKGLNPIDWETFRTKPNLLVSRVVSPDYGVLAAHAYSLDPAAGIVRGLYNASAFRAFAQDNRGRRQAGVANVFLYHADFLHFRQMGFHTYDFGGYGTPESGSTFKDQFRGRLVEQYNYYPVAYYLLRRIRKVMRRWSR